MKFSRFSLLIVALMILSLIVTGQNVNDPTGYVQVFEVNSKLPNIKNKYTFENDTLVITYYFWASRGIVQLGIKNKLEVPIYINWKKSYYKNNYHVLSYFPEGKMDQDNYDVYQTYMYEGRSLSMIDYEAQYNTASGKDYATKIDSITEIRPHSFYMRLKYHLIPSEFYRFDIAAKSEKALKTDTGKDSTTVYFNDFTTENTPLKFLSYVTYSANKNFAKESGILNEFWVNKVKEMEAKQFRGEKVGTDQEGKAIYKFPYRASTMFYIEIQKKNAVAYRKSKGMK